MCQKALNGKALHTARPGIVFIFLSSDQEYFLLRSDRLRGSMCNIVCTRVRCLFLGNKVQSLLDYFGVTALQRDCLFFFPLKCQRSKCLVYRAMAAGFLIFSGSGAPGCFFQVPEEER